MNHSCFAEGKFQAEFLVCHQQCGPDCSKTICPNEQKEIRLLSEINYRLQNGTSITISPGFEFDGASIPQLCWTSVGHPLEHRFLFAALLHDALYSAQYLPRKTADLCFKEFLLNFSGVGTLTAWKMYSAVRIFGGIPWKKKTDTQIKAARMFIHLEETAQ